MDAKQRKAAVNAAKQLRSLSGYDLVHCIAGLVGLKRLVDAYEELAHHTGSDGLTILWVSPEAKAQLAGGDVLGAARSIEDANPALEGSITRLLGSVSPDQARLAYAELKGLDCSTTYLLTHGPLDIAGEAYECVQDELGVKVGTGRGEFFTPTSITQLLARIVMPEAKLNERFSDPACGSGRTLIEAAGRLIQTYGHLEQITPEGHPAGGGRRVLTPPPAQFIAQDIAPMGPCMFRIAMVALGYHNALVKVADTLRDPMTAQEEHAMEQARRSAMWAAMLKRFPPPQANAVAATVEA
jgi:hypothetical protein